MNLKDIVAVTGLSGLYKVVAKRHDGMIITSLETGKTTFASSRIHLFTPLDSITVYLENNDTVELPKVMVEIKKQESENPLPSPKADAPALRAFFRKILPNHDEEKVYISDIIKIVRWFRLLEEKGLIDLEPEDSRSEQGSTTSLSDQKSITPAPSSSEDQPVTDIAPPQEDTTLPSEDKISAAEKHVKRAKGAKKSAKKDS